MSPTIPVPAPDVALRLALDPPLDPDGDDARSALRRELARPEYHDTDLLRRIQDWVARFFDDGVAAVSDLSGVPAFLLLLLMVGALVALGLLVSRARRTTRVRNRSTPALTDEAITAAQLRARAEAALAEGRHDDALLDAYRALAVRQVEQGRIDDLPQATAHELAGSLGEAFAAQRERIEAAADAFDAVLYGDRAATREQAAAVLSLDAELGGRTVRR